MKISEVNGLVYGDWVSAYGEKGSITEVVKNDAGAVERFLLFDGRESWAVDICDMPDSEIADELERV